MKVKVKLMGMLKEKSPEGGELELPENTSIAEVLKQLTIAPTSVQAFSINGAIQRDQSTELADGDELVVLAPVGGG